MQFLLDRIWRPPIGVDTFPADHDKYYKPWGFIIYRTCYASESKQQWEQLLELACFSS